MTSSTDIMRFSDVLNHALMTSSFLLTVDTKFDVSRDVSNEIAGDASVRCSILDLSSVQRQRPIAQDSHTQFVSGQRTSVLVPRDLWKGRSSGRTFENDPFVRQCCGFSR